MSRIVKKTERLFDDSGVLIDEYIRRMYFKTELDTEVEIKVEFGFLHHEIAFIPDEEDFFWEETLDAIVRYLGHTSFYITENSDSVEVNCFDGVFDTFLEELAHQVDIKLEKILKEKGIDPNAKNYALANEIDDDLYDGHFNYDIYEDVRDMYKYDEDEEEYTELIKNIDDSVFSESIEEVENNEK